MHRYLLVGFDGSALGSFDSSESGRAWSGICLDFSHRFGTYAGNLFHRLFVLDEMDEWALLLIVDRYNLSRKCKKWE